LRAGLNPLNTSSIPLNGRVRPALPQDLASLLELEASFPSDNLSRRSFRHLLIKANANVLVFEIQNKIAGNVIVLYRRNTSHARLYSLIVDPQHQQQGIARALMQAAEDAARNKGCNFMNLELRPDNEAALRLYERSGYKMIKREEAFYEDGSTALRMQKLIGSE
jgi:ribosomal protein S18 acetylase RimI-like enzyme